MLEDDRRRESREPITLMVEYAGAEDLVSDYTENLSAGGTFVQTERQLEIGRKVRLVLSFPGLLQPITLDGAVQWVRAGGDEERGLGIQFLDYDERVREQLAAVIDAIQRRSPDLVGRHLRILVVEDNPYVARFIRDGLSGTDRFGDRVTFEFVVSADGRAAMEVLEGARFDAAIIDMYLPIMDGSSLIAHVRADERLREMPIIAVSAGGIDARSSALGAGADLFLDKPMRLRQIIDSMATLIGLTTRASR